uniref:ATP synthase complex subunit 8 n=1 Tax=Syncrossus hymenophysa TaxID=322124 RepID=A0A1Q2TAI0_9TELE|nr:ATPase subunit 8 [Syncrossus hymenophysa]BAW88630.1 ATPase subunit 8 [Syncrossus hymenophysa]
MPQLNPAPWFSILTFSWLIFLIVIPTKILSHIMPNEPIHISAIYHMYESWDWPWQ